MLKVIHTDPRHIVIWNGPAIQGECNSCRSDEKRRSCNKQLKIIIVVGLYCNPAG